MVRILSALVLVPIAAAAVWFLSPVYLLGVALAVLAAAFVEYVRLVEQLGVRLPRVAAGTAAAAVCLAAGWPGAALEVPLAAVLIALAAQAVGDRATGPAALHGLGASVFGAVWLGLPIGTLVAVDAGAGRGALLLLMAVVVASDTAQYYTGTLLGRHRLAPAISPKKSVEGAAGGFAAGIATMVIGGQWALPTVGAWWLAGLGAAVVACGILGDLLESLLKRSAGVKDSSGVIPGHGGVLDRIDALLLAAPAFWIGVRFLV